MKIRIPCWLNNDLKVKLNANLLDLKKIKNKYLEFELNFNTSNLKKSIILKPFYDIHNERYSIYFNKITNGK